MHKIDYIFKQDSLTLHYNGQSICFHSFNQISKTNFNKFSDSVQQKRPQDLNDVFRMARKFKTNSQAGHKSSVIF